MIFDWIAIHDAPPTCVVPTYVLNGLPSRSHGLFCPKYCPDVLVPTSFAPLREIHFPSPDDGMVTLPPCFINHKVARYNRVTPPFNQQRQAARAALRLPSPRPLHIHSQDHHLGMYSCTSSRLSMMLSLSHLLTQLPRWVGQRSGFGYAHRRHSTRSRLL